MMMMTYTALGRGRAGGLTPAGLLLLKLLEGDATALTPPVGVPGEGPTIIK